MIKILNTITGWFTSITYTIVALIKFVINTIESLINLFIKIPSYVSFLATSLDMLPSVIIPFCLASISIYVIYLVIGRDRS